MTRRNLWLITLAFLILSAAACSPDQPTEAPLETQTGYPAESGAYPPPDYVGDIDSGYPIDTDLDAVSDYYVDEITLPEPGENTGVVYGTLLTASGDKTPYLAPTLYLGRFLASESGEDDAPMLGSLSIEEDPKGIQAVTGEFFFDQVPPGRYGLFVWSPASAYILEDTEAGESLIIEVLAGETVDLGTIYIP